MSQTISQTALLGFSLLKSKRNIFLRSTRDVLLQNSPTTLGTLAPFYCPWEQLTRDWESRVQAPEESPAASSPSGGESGSSRDGVPHVPEPGRTAQLSDDQGTPLCDSSEPEGVMDTDGPAGVGTEEAASQSAASSPL